MDSNTTPDTKISLIHIIGLFLLTVLLSVSVTLWVVKYSPLPAGPGFHGLTTQEVSILQHKLNLVNATGLIKPNMPNAVVFSEKEINALLGKRFIPNAAAVSLGQGEMQVYLRE